MAALKQAQKLKIQHQLSGDQIQLMQLLEVPLANLEQRIKEEVIDNPALEVDEFSDSLDDISDQNSENDIDWDNYQSSDDNDYDPNYSGYKSEEDKIIPIKDEESFIDSLYRQLMVQDISETQKSLAEHIVASLSDDGYLSRDLQGMMYDLAFQGITTTVDELNEALEIVQDFEPSGIGARDLRECLLIQLYRKKASPDVLLALEIIENNFEAYSKRHFDKLLKKLHISEEQFHDADQVIKRLNPKPGKTIGSANRVETIIPDFKVFSDDGELVLEMESSHVPTLYISKDFKEMMKNRQEASKKNKEEKEALQFINSRVKSAEIFIENIRQRYMTMQAVMSCIIDKQKDFFISGDIRQLKPMILEDVANEVDLNISTVSRVSRSKYVQTDFGVFSLKEFFSESILNEEGVEISTSAVKDIVNELIKEENKLKPLSDQKIQEILVEKGFPIARRTVAKYRNQLGLPVASRRKEL